MPMMQLTQPTKAIKEIKEGIDGPLTITEINQIVYATALIITEQIGLKPRQHSRIGKKQKEPTWKAKSKKEIQKQRSDLSILTEIQKTVQTSGRENGKRLRNAMASKNLEICQLSKKH